MSLDFLSSIDMWVVLGYLLLTLLVGLYRSSVKADTMEEYALASRQFTLPVMVATIYATLVGGGSTIGFVQQMYKVGIIFVILSIGETINKLIIANKIVSRVVRFRKALTVGDVLSYYFGPGAKIVAGVAATFWAFGLLGAQVSAIGTLLHFTLGLPFEVAAILGSSILILYSAFGGVRAVTLTDALQFLILMIAIPMVCNVGLQKFGGYVNLFNAIPGEYFTTSLVQERSIWGFIALAIIFAIPCLKPQIFQRLLMMQDVDQGRKAFNIVAVIDFPFMVVLTIIGLLAIVTVPKGESSLALLHLVNTYLPEGMRGFVIAGMLAVIMSTADSILNSASVAFAHDVYKPLNKGITEKQEIIAAKLITLLIGIFATSIAIKFRTILEIVIETNNVWVPVIVVPLYAALFNIRAPKRSFYTGVICGLTTVFLWKTLKVYSYVGIDSLFPGMIGNAIGFFIARIGYDPEQDAPRHEDAPDIEEPVFSPRKKKV